MDAPLVILRTPHEAAPHGATHRNIDFAIKPLLAQATRRHSIEVLIPIVRARLRGLGELNKTADVREALVRPAASAAPNEIAAVQTNVASRRLGGPGRTDRLLDGGVELRRSLVDDGAISARAQRRRPHEERNLKRLAHLRPGPRRSESLARISPLLPLALVESGARVDELNDPKR